MWDETAAELYIYIARFFEENMIEISTKKKFYCKYSSNVETSLASKSNLLTLSS